MDPVETLAVAVLLGLAAHAGTVIIRAFTPLRLLLIKPWACDLCMGWWCSIIGTVVWFVWVTPNVLDVPTVGRAGCIAVAATAIGRWLNRLNTRFGGGETE